MVKPSPLTRRLPWAAATAALVCLLGLTGSSAAQSYSFQIPQENVVATLQAGGTLDLDYTIVLANDASGDPIDFVDVGLPTSSYDLGQVQASLDGNAVTNIENSSSGQPGITLALGALAIPPGAKGTVHVTVAGVGQVLHPGTGQQNYASFQFSPSWFDPSLAHGSTDLSMSIVLPPGVSGDQAVYYPPQNWPGGSDPASALDAEGRVVYTWTSSQASPSTQYVFGAGFPAAVVPAGSIVTPPAPSFNWGALAGALPVLLVFLFIGLSIASGYRAQQRQRLDYMPPKISVEGMGIKRGLTAVEAAILLEQPLEKVLTMILFSVIKKGAAKVTRRDPFELEITDPLPEGLQPYEVEYLEAFHAPERDRREKLQAMTVNLVNGVSEKMRGFSRKETVAYYQDIVKRAWQQVEAADTPELKLQRFDEQMDWTMLDGDFSGRTRRVLPSGPLWLPAWWVFYDPGYHPGPVVPAGGGVPSLAGAGGGAASMGHLPGSDFAAQVANSVQNFAGNVIGNVTSFAGGVSAKTNPQATSSGRSSGRVGGAGTGCACACACACAGCACACAGGGR